MVRGVAGKCKCVGLGGVLSAMTALAALAAQGQDRLLPVPGVLLLHCAVFGNRRLSMIEASALCKSFAGRAAVKEMSFSVQPGEVAGFLGPNGAGKSTTMKMLTGFLAADAGTARLCGDRKSTRLNSSHVRISYAVFCLKK